MRTRAGNRWVFPKGHVEPSDPSPAAAAGREALEEAGVRGVIDPTRLGVVPYWKARGEIAMAVFLLRWDGSALATSEAGRDPSWFSAESTRAELQRNRTAQQASGLLQALDAALQRLDGDAPG